MKRAQLTIVLAFLGVSVFAVDALAQERRVASPSGRSATQVGGRHDMRVGYVGGHWLEITYGRPIRRGRDLFGPDDHREWLNDGAPVWRAGANVSTQLTTEVPLVFGSTTVAPGDYTVFIDMQPDGWTFIVSSWPAQTSYDYENKEALFGAFDYTPDRDVVRLPMTRETLPYSHDQLSWQFIDMTDTTGRLALFWDTQMASVSFTTGD